MKYRKEYEKQEKEKMGKFEQLIEQCKQVQLQPEKRNVCLK